MPLRLIRVVSVAPASFLWHNAAVADQLEQCVPQLGFIGALVDSDLCKTYYDCPEFDPLWAALKRLGVSIDVHPAYPRIQEVNGTGGLYTLDNKVYP